MSLLDSVKEKKSLGLVQSTESTVSKKIQKFRCHQMERFELMASLMAPSQHFQFNLLTHLNNQILSCSRGK